MTFRRSRPFLTISILALLAGCAESRPGGDDAIFTLPTATPSPYSPPVSESYVIQRAPVAAPYYAPADIYEVMAADEARREAEARRLALAELQRRADAQRLVEQQRLAVAQVTAPTFGVLDQAQAQGAQNAFEATARAEARAEAAEAEAATLAAELAEARQAVADAEAAARAAESAAQQAVRTRVAELAAERRAAPPRADTVDRANPTTPPRSVLGRFATRPTPPPTVTPLPTPSIQPRVTPPPPPRPAPPAPARPIVERAPIPGLKPYILARSAFPSAKPRRAPPTRSFGIGTPSVLSAPGIASIAPTEVSIPREPGGDLSARFFPTPGKPSTLGTGRDTALDLVSIDAVPYGIGGEVGDSIDGDAATAEWTDAVALIENGEVEALSILEDSDLVLTLCSGRSITTTPPDLAAAATLTAPQIICGQNKPLELR